MNPDTLFHALGITVLLCPLLLLAVLGFSSLLNLPLSESATGRFTEVAVVCGLVSSVCILAGMLYWDTRYVPIEIGNWVVLPNHHFHFHIKCVFDRLSVPFVILSYTLCGTVSAFASRYLHRDPGFPRFFNFYALFFAGMVISSLAGTIETLFLGWELVGLSSALLVAYFVERPGPVRNGLRVWSVYRIADAAFLLAAVAMHHLIGEGEFSRMMGTGPWPDSNSTISSTNALFIGGLLLIAAAGKSGLVPFSGWLPRAMEGPTPSSAVFYGALSVHLGAFLLLRVSPLLDQSLPLRIAVVTLGLISAIFSAMASRVQNDAKSMLAFASLTQVSIIVIEIGLGFDYLALTHIIGHACLRTLQLLRAPTLLRDYQTLENAIGGRLTAGSLYRGGWVPAGMRLRSYRFAFERGYLDNALDTLIVEPFLRLFRLFDSWERRWTDWLSGAASRESDQATTPPDIVEETR